ncbi:Rossmann-like and DUF2520 domain-containing protein [Sphingobacterium hungaricum]|uniref:DUF2520 domain-containing protein n=1 Tax=Sphingobacterium hungaricum TaxID=2082723 RepID=A0A928UYG1_9SPHI|nr:Rossmann-like and DUF2520 domain-containing protein [Sphingobacterium hungaricum]MBE8713690.1 DUF2520 domain-containing protein [Sphingobacterium hungaricum]
MKIVLIGSGNVSTAFAHLFESLGHDILQVYSRSLDQAERLAAKLGTSATSSLTDINKTANLYVVAVTDNAIEQVIEELPQSLKGIVVHTSGATSMDVLTKFPLCGVIYPIQSISKDSDLRSKETPIGIEGNNEIATALLLEIGKSLSKKSFYCDSKQRLALHVAAVFSNNFTNALYQVAFDILKANNLSFDLLKPIIAETAEKVQHHIPKEVQTGPAKRNDQKTIDRHLDFLSGKPNWETIYQELTRLIRNKDT